MDCADILESASAMKDGLTKTVQEVDTHVNTTLLIIILSRHCRDMPATLWCEWSVQPQYWIL